MFRRDSLGPVARLGHQIRAVGQQHVWRRGRNHQMPPGPWDWHPWQDLGDPGRDIAGRLLIDEATPWLIDGPPRDGWCSLTAAPRRVAFHASIGGAPHTQESPARPWG